MKKMFITGGAGFVESNAAHHFYKKKWQVYIFDNLSRKGTFFNIKWLKKNGFYQRRSSMVRKDYINYWQFNYKRTR